MMNQKMWIITALVVVAILLIGTLTSISASSVHNGTVESIRTAPSSIEIEVTSDKEFPDVKVALWSLGLNLWTPSTYSACIPSGDQDRINRVLEQGGAGAKAVLCPRAEFRLTGTVRFTAANQEIYTEGLPTDNTRARLMITGRSLTGAVEGLHKSGVKLRNVIIDGGRSRLGYRSGEGTEDREALITMGGTALGQVVEYVKAFDTRSWSTLQIAEGDTAEGSAEACTGAQIRHNEFGPAGEADGTWADGISLACRNSTVSDNVITDATDGAIVIFGAPGSLITRNHIRAVSRTGFLGIAMVDYNPYHGNFAGTRVTQNTIDAAGAPIRAGIAMGPRTWFCSRDSSHWPSPDWTGWPNRGGSVTHNILQGNYMGYGYVVDGVQNWTVLDNVDRSKHSGTPGYPGCGDDQLPSPPRGFQKHGKHTQGTFQREFEEAYLEPVNGLCLPGDLNNDNRIDVRDGQLLANMVSSPDSWDVCRGDLNGDRIIDEQDIKILAGRITSPSSIEIEVTSDKEFPVRNELLVLRIGEQEVTLSRYPESGDTHTLIFTLTPEEFAKTATGDPITVYYGRGSESGEQWNFGPLDKGLSAKSLSPQGLYDSNDHSTAVVNAKDSSDVRLKNISGKVLIGSYIENKFADTAYANLVAEEFSAGQITWFAAWGGWQSENSFNFADFNAVVNWLRQNGKSTHMHMLVGPNFYMPEWLIKGKWTNDKLDAFLKNMIYSIMDTNNNKNKVDVWNVVNELFDDDGNYVTDATFTDVIWYQLGWEADQSGLSGVDKINARHPVFIRKAFQYARDKTSAKLEYRDHIEGNNPASGRDRKNKAVYQLLKHMLNSGIPVDAVGIQGHLDIGKVNGLTQNNELQNTVEKFKALGLEVYITELDIGTAGQTWDDALAIQQATDYYNYLRQAINGGASRIYIWGIADGSDPTWRTDEHPLPWDGNYKRKPAYYDIVRALKDTM